MKLKNKVAMCIIVFVLCICIKNYNVNNSVKEKIVLTNTTQNKKVIVSGRAVGVKLKLNGVMVLNIMEVLNEDGYKEYPLKRSGIRVGDIITQFNDKKILSVHDLVSMVSKSKGKEFTLMLKRRGKKFRRKLKAVKSYEDNKYHLGIWVRDSIKGIGTVTFYDPSTGHFGALGHGILDLDTKEIFTSKGEILKSSILSIKKGRVGIPGELKGIVVSNDNNFGNIIKNTNDGIYGILKKDSMESLGNKTYEVCPKENITCGKASIITNVLGNRPQEYDINILKISKRNKKGMHIKITDKRLIKSTGGIVQGMSGCPILQNGKIVGAVTHVFVNDPTKGYGIFIENMLDNIAS